MRLNQVTLIKLGEPEKYIFLRLGYSEFSVLSDLVGDSNRAVRYKGSTFISGTETSEQDIIISHNLDHEDRVDIHVGWALFTTLTHKEFYEQAGL